jgi:hypothetical protein
VSFPHSKGLRRDVTNNTYRVENTSVPERRLRENLVLKSYFQNVHKPNTYWRYFNFPRYHFRKFVEDFD